MKPIALILLLNLGLIYNQVSAQRSRQTQSVLWKIQSPNSTKTSYLLGAMHNFGKEWVASYPKLDSIVKVSEVYLCETTIFLDSGKTAKMPVNASPQRMKAKQLFGRNYDKVNKYFVAETGSGLTENIDTSGNQAEVLKGMVSFLRHEWTAGIGLKISFEGMDADLLFKAASRNIPCVALDEDRITNGMTSTRAYLQNEVKDIVSYVDDLTDKDFLARKAAGADPVFEALMQYNKGKFSFDFTADDNAPERFLKVRTRNRLWMKKIPAYLIKNKTFIVVGAGHLDGKTGLLMELKKLGFKIAPVNLL